MKRALLLALGLSFTLLTLNYAHTQEKGITILYTGETHSMLYPCSCPRESDGGVARRATLIKKLKDADTLVLDSGGFSAGGLLDEYTQNIQMDMERTLVNLKAIEIIAYDALAVGDDEFNFGNDFLLQQAAKSKAAMVSCNILTSTSSGAKAGLFKPYIIKEVQGIRIAVVGVTSLAARNKAVGLEIVEPKLALKAALEDLRKNNLADLVIVLSHLGENEDLNLLKDINGIDILIIGHSRAKDEPLTKVGQTLVVRPSWQGRKLGKLSFSVKENKIVNYKAEELRLSDKIKDDPQVLAILPRCFSDANCRKQGHSGICQEPGTMKAHCRFSQASRIPLEVITPRQCRTCDSQRTVNNLKSLFPGLSVSYLYYPDAKANKLIDSLGIKTLPAYIFAKELRQEKGFDALRENLEPKGELYMLKPQFAGVSYFPKREKIKGKLDLFVSLYEKDSAELLSVMRNFNPTVHFLAVEQKEGFEAAKGNLELEDDLRAVCVGKYYPENFWDYLICRAKNVNTSWWQDCLNGADYEKIRSCARGEEGRQLLKENIALNREAEVMFGPTYLLDNQEIFASRVVPKKEDFEKVLKAK